VTAAGIVPLRLDRHLAPDALATALEQDVRTGLTATPKTLPPKWFYDARGSVLFDEITRLEEYYPTRREKEILAREAASFAELTGADTLVELGSGTSQKTRLLLDALGEAGTLRRYVPFDVDESVLTSAGQAVAQEYPGIAVHGVIGDFEQHLPLLPAGGRRLFAFLGGTVGNLDPQQRGHFLRALAGQMGPDDALLLGTDLVKDPERLVRAYDDASGVTAAFNRNVLHVLRHRLGADVDPDAFDHVAVWDPEQEWIEMRLRARRSPTVRLLDLEVDFADGEELRTEISAKFTRARVAHELAVAGLELLRWETDTEATTRCPSPGSQPRALPDTCARSSRGPRRRGPAPRPSASAQERRTRRRSGGSSRSSTAAVAAPYARCGTMSAIQEEAGQVRGSVTPSTVIGPLVPPR